LPSLTKEHGCRFIFACDNVKGCEKKLKLEKPCGQGLLVAINEEEQRPGQAARHKKGSDRLAAIAPEFG
jgi:hypothetical protein